MLAFKSDFILFLPIHGKTNSSKIYKNSTSWQSSANNLLLTN